MIDPATKKPNKEHTTSPVPLVYLDLISHPFNNVISGSKLAEENNFEYLSRPAIGVIADIAPTVLNLLKLRVPRKMSNVNLINTI